MPLVNSNYHPAFPFTNGHLSTIYSSVFRKIDGLVQERERINLPDGDFLDIDWSFAKKPTQKVILLLHGLEGNAQRPYILGSAKQFNTMGIDACAINLRGCSGEINRLFRSYHSGATEDLEAVIQHVLNTKKYSEIYLKGFSLGGNITLKYLGENKNIPKEIKAAMAISVPCNLHSSLLELLKPINILYANKFKKDLIKKLRVKQKMFPKLISDSEISAIKTLKDFDDIYTSKAHGYKDALDYYEQCSSLSILQQISVPTLLINALNDSFLGEKCYPVKEAKANKKLHLEIPLYGGHVGFYHQNNMFYTERRVQDFIKELQ
ncbi:MAG: alpha/beta fold hydrolase [Cellulophaga sp.]